MTARPDPQLRRILDEVVGLGLSVNSGVYAAVDGALTMRLDARGEYEYVGLDESYRGSAADLLRVSALAGAAPDENEVAQELFAGEPDVRHDAVAGFSVGAFAGWVAESDYRERGSSGGLTTWLLAELLTSGEVDAVVHMRPSTEGALFSYQVSRSVDELRAGAKSRYYPGELSAALREITRVPGRYAVVGIPSFIYEVRLLQRLDPVFRERIRYAVGLICGHQKTANYADYLAWRGGADPGTLRRIDFRKKVPGRPASDYATEVTAMVDGVESTWTVPQREIPGSDWGLGYFKSHFSDVTQDVLNETADIVMGDAWLPEYVTDSRGTNVVLVRRRALLDLLARAAQDGRLRLDDLDVDDVIRSQRALVRHNITEAPVRYRLLARRGEAAPKLRWPAPARVSRLRRAVQRARLSTSARSHEAFAEAVAAGQLSRFDAAMRRPVRKYRAAQNLVRVGELLRRGPRGVAAAVGRRITRLARR